MNEEEVVEDEVEDDAATAPPAAASSSSDPTPAASGVEEEVAGTPALANILASMPKVQIPPATEVGGTAPNAR